MPQNVAIAAFIFGAVLLLIAILGTVFKFFGAEVSTTVGKLSRLAAGVIGSIFIGLSLLYPPEGLGSLFRAATTPAVPTMALVSYWNGARADNLTTTNEGTQRGACEHGYSFGHLEGYVYEMEQPGTIKLFRYRRGLAGGRFEYFTTTAEAVPNGYDPIYQQLEGFIYKEPPQGIITVPLHRYYHPSRQEYFTTASATGVWSASLSAYEHQGIEGFILPLDDRAHDYSCAVIIK